MTAAEAVQALLILLEDETLDPHVRLRCARAILSAVDK